MKNEWSHVWEHTPLKYDGFCFCSADTNFAICSCVNFKKVSNQVDSVNISDHGKCSLIMIDTLQSLIVKMDCLFGHTCWHSSPKGCDGVEHTKLINVHLFCHMTCNIVM